MGKCIHFVGIFGSGMSAIATYLAGTGVKVTGSDRLDTSADARHIRVCLETAGCGIFPQDGSGVSGQTKALVVSTAIEESNPDLVAAKALGIPVLHRSDVLAQIIQTKKAVVVAGTSGKSTVTAMIFELLVGCGKAPSLISGAALKSLAGPTAIGNSHNGNSDLLIVEGDESDGTLVKYAPYGAVILNLSKDHKPEAEVFAMFETLCQKAGWVIKNRDDPKLDPLSTDLAFGFKGGTYTAKKTTGGLYESCLLVDGHPMSIKAPGDHNASNFLAALAVCQKLGCTLGELARAAKHYQGVDRRFVVSHTKRGITVIDDFAHNPEKIRAAITTAKDFSNRLVVMFQPHGFGPTRFLKDDYAAMFMEVLRPNDVLLLLPIYYAGGTAIKDITSQDLINLMTGRTFRAYAPHSRQDTYGLAVVAAHPGDAILIMGARDPSLPAFIQEIICAIDP
ncbi:MAG: Mur ligase domain-containing protein [Turicibacter sp.]|nr:Mur ligase domain-containing protein [Turicibacter sp.]